MTAPMLPPSASPDVDDRDHDHDDHDDDHDHAGAMQGNKPPEKERSRNAKAQARHRAKRKAYIEQLEETVAKLRAALSLTPEQVAQLPPAQIRIRELEHENQRLMRENESLSSQLYYYSRRSNTALDGPLPPPPHPDYDYDAGRDHKRRRMTLDGDTYLTPSPHPHAAHSQPHHLRIAPHPHYTTNAPPLSAGAMSSAGALFSPHPASAATGTYTMPPTPTSGHPTNTHNGMPPPSPSPLHHAQMQHAAHAQAQAQAQAHAQLSGGVNAGGHTASTAGFSSAGQIQVQARGATVGGMGGVTSAVAMGMGYDATGGYDDAGYEDAGAGRYTIKSEDDSVYILPSSGYPIPHAAYTVIDVESYTPPTPSSALAPGPLHPRASGGGGGGADAWTMYSEERSSAGMAP